jgi:replicative DNA helicase
MIVPMHSPIVTIDPMPMPTCPQIEAGVAGTLLQYPMQVVPMLVGAGIDHRHFHDFAASTIVAEVMRRWSEGTSTDWISVSHALAKDVPIPTVTNLATGPALVSVVPEWLVTVRDYALRRELIRSCHANARLASEEDGRSALASITHDVSILGQSGDSGGHSIKEGLTELLRSFADGDVKQGIPTGWPELDRISPVRRGDMVVIAAQAKGGKSTLALSYMAEVCRRGLPALMLSLEMPSRDIIEKMLAREARVRLDTMYARTFGAPELSRIAQANKAMSEWQADIRSDCYDLPAIIAAARASKAQRPDLALVVVDYLQLVKGPQGDSREREVAEVSRSLRMLAMELDCVVVALSQLNDEGKLRESRAIGQDATAVWAIGKQEEDAEDDRRTLHIPIQRNGQSGVSCQLEFLGQFASFGHATATR